MILVERKEGSPASLASAAALKEAQDAEGYYDTWSPGDAAFKEFTHYRGYDVQQALRRIFNWKCAYCERQLEKGSFEVEHYRPKGAVSGCDHSGYWWLALVWTNLLPTCAGCNKGLLQHVVTADMTVAAVEAMQAASPKDLHGKGTQFPVGGARLTAKNDDHFGEAPHLIDPTRTDPEPELKWRHDAAFSVVEPADTPGGSSVLGEETIRCVALNRVDLVENRTQILDRLRTQRIQIMLDLEKDAAEAADPTAMATHLTSALRRVGDMKLAGAPDQPFAGMVRAFVKTFRNELSAWAASHNLLVDG